MVGDPGIEPGMGHPGGVTVLSKTFAFRDLAFLFSKIDHERSMKMENSTFLNQATGFS